MAETLTQRSDVTNSSTQTFYDNVLLRRAHPYEVHANFAQNRPIPQNVGNTIQFRRYEHLNLATTPLSEGQTPDGQKLSKTDVQATVKQYGDYIHITDVVDLTARDPVLTEAAEVLGEQMGRTRDVLVKNHVVGGYVQEVEAGTSGYDKVNTDSGSSISTTSFDNAIDNLLANNARFITKAIRPSSGYNTVPIRPAYIAIMHPDFRQSIEGFGDFTPISQYPSSEPIMDGEWGAYRNIRILFSTLADSGEMRDAFSMGSASDYVVPVFGADAYGVTELTGGAATNIVKSEGGTSDPLNQRQTSGWKMFMAATILNPAFMTVIYANT